MSGVKGINAGRTNWNYKHGQTNTHLFRVWSHMRERCEREKHPYYKDYGGRGISVCSEWRDFLPFKDWAERSGFQIGLTIDRIDTNGNYEPANCRWVTQKEQQNNKRSNRVIEYAGEHLTLTQTAEKYGINKTTLKERLNNGWDIDDAITRPVRARARGYRPSRGADMRGERK